MNKKKKEKLAQQKKELAQKTKEEDFILNQLKISMKVPRTFTSNFGDLKAIMLKEEFPLPNPIQISSQGKIELEQFVILLEKIHSYRLYECEAEKHIIISDLFATCLLMLKSLTSKGFLMHDKFFIKPDFVIGNEKDVVRKVDCSIFKDDNSIIVFICKIKEDCYECLRQNADQLRAYCISYKKKVCRGIATNGTTWYFTQFEKMGGKFIVSKSYDFIKFSHIRFRGFVNHEEFFGLLMGYILESEEYMTKNNN